MSDQVHYSTVSYLWLNLSLELILELSVHLLELFPVRHYRLYRVFINHEPLTHIDKRTVSLHLLLYLCIQLSDILSDRCEIFVDCSYLSGDAHRCMLVHLVFTAVDAICRAGSIVWAVLHCAVVNCLRTSFASTQIHVFFFIDLCNSVVFHEII